MAFSSLDVYNATTQAQEKSTATLGGLMQNAYQDAAQGITEAAKINQGVVQSAIGAQQVAIDTWYKQQELQRQQQQLGLQAQEVGLRSRQMDLMQDYHQQEIDVNKAKLQEKEDMATRAIASRQTIAGLNGINNSLKIKRADIASALTVDTAALRKLSGGGENPMSFISPSQDDILNQKTQIPLLQDRIAKNQAQLEKLNGNLDLVSSTASAMAAGGDPKVLFDQLSSSLAPKDLHPDSYPITIGEPITNEQADIRNGIGTSLDDSQDLQTYSDTQDPSNNITNGAPVKMTAQEALARINAFVASAGEKKMNEAAGYPTIQNMLATMVDPAGQNQIRQMQVGMLSDAARTFYDEGMNPSQNNQKLERFGPEWMKDFRRVGGDPNEFEKVKQDFTNMGKWTADGSLPQAGVVSNQFASKFVSDPKLGTSNNLSGYEKTQLGNNLVSNYFQPKQNPNNVTVNGRFSPIKNNGAIPINEQGDIIVPRDPNIPRTEEQIQSDKQDAQDKHDQETQDKVNSIVYDKSGNVDTKSIYAKLIAMPAEKIVDSEDISNLTMKAAKEQNPESYSGYSAQDIQALKVKKIQELLKPGNIKIKKIKNLLLNYEDNPTSIYQSSSTFNFAEDQTIKDIADRKTIPSDIQSTDLVGSFGIPPGYNNKS